MKVMLDTNVLISILLFPNNRMNYMMETIFSKHRLVLSSYVVNELKNVIKRKFPSKMSVIERLLFTMNYEHVYTPEKLDETLFKIRDLKRLSSIIYSYNRKY